MAEIIRYNFRNDMQSHNKCAINLMAALASDRRGRGAGGAAAVDRQEDAAVRRGTVRAGVLAVRRAGGGVP